MGADTAMSPTLKLLRLGAFKRGLLTPHGAVLLQEALGKHLVICHRPIGRNHHRRHPVPDLLVPRPGAVLCDEGRAAVQRGEPVACSQAADSTSAPPT